jgi:FSR family fosmidomycin resistance protein-like MFS transporter
MSSPNGGYTYVDRKKIWFISGLHFWVDLYAVFFPVYMVIAGLDPVRAAAITAVTSLISNGVQPFMGYWADRVRGKLPVFFGLVVGAAGMSMIGLTRNYGLLFLFVLISRLGISLFHPAGTNIAGAAAGRGSDFGFSIFLTTGVVGMALSQPYFSYVTGLLGNRFSVVLAVPALLFALLYLLRPGLEVAGPESRIDLPGAGRIFLKRLGPMLLLLLIMVFRHGFITAVGFFIAKMFADWGFSRLSYSIANTVFNLAGGAGLLLSGVLAVRVRPKAILLVSLLAFLPFFALLLVFGERGALLPAFLSLAAMGFIMNTSHVQNILMGHRIMPEITATVSGILMGLAWSIGEFGLPAGAAFAGRFAWAPGSSSSLAVLLSFPLSAVVLALLLPPWVERAGVAPDRVTAGRAAKAGGSAPSR